MDAPPDLPKPGEIIAGKYELVRPLGRGGMGAVFEAKHLRLRQRVAIKFLRPDLLDVADCVMRFEREGRAAALVTSSNAARIFDVDVTPSGIPYMVIEFLEGHDLSVELRNRATLPVAEAVDIVLQACSAMAEAHSLGIVHRDLKPANLFLCVKGSSRTVKVLDFGVSKLLSEEIQATTPSLTLGTPQYMSPEQILASKDVDLQSDIWSLGVILYKLISGRLPFEAESATAFVVTVVTEEPLPIEQHAALPPELAAAVMKALAKQRSERWQLTMDFARAIEPYGTGHVAFTPPTLRPPAPVPRPAEIAVDVDFETQQRPAEALPTEANWTHNRAPMTPRRGRMLAFAAATVLGLAGVGVALAMRAPKSVANDVSPPPTSSDLSGVPATEPPPTAAQATTTTPLPAPSASTSETPVSAPTPESAPRNPVGAAVAPHKPASPPVTMPASSSRPPSSATPSSSPRARDPVHL